MDDEELRQYLKGDEDSHKQQFFATLQSNNEAVASYLDAKGKGTDIRVSADTPLGSHSPTAAPITVSPPPPVTAVRDSAATAVTMSSVSPMSSIVDPGPLPASASAANDTKASADKHPFPQDGAMKSLILEQESIMRACQADNERLYTADKQLRQRVKELEEALAVARTRSQLSHGDRGAMQELDLLRLEKKEFTVRLAELQLEVDTLKKEKKDLERRVASVDWAKVEDGAVELRHLQVRLKREEQEHELAVGEMKRKIAWYAERQNSSQLSDQIMKEQNDTITQLRVKVAELEGQMSAKHGGKRMTEKDKLIRDQQRQIAEMEDVIRNRHPNSVAELIRATKPSVEETAAVKAMDGKIHALEAQLQEQERLAGAAMDRMRVETDGLRSQYEGKLQRLEEEMRARLQAAQSRKVRELEKSLTDTRRYYTDKVKELEHTVLELRRGGGKMPLRHGPASTAKPPASPNEKAGAGKGDSDGKASAASSSSRTVGVQVDFGPAPTGAPRGPYDPSADERAQAMQHHIYTLERELAAQQGRGGGYGGQMPPQAVQVTDSATVSAMQMQLSNSAREIGVHRTLLCEAQESLRATIVQYEDKIRQVRKEHTAELDALRRQHADALADVRQKSHEEVQTALSKQSIVSTDKILQSYKRRNEGEYLELVAERLQALEREQALRDADRNRMVDEIRRMADFELSVEKQKMALAVEEKNTEINRFRVQLDGLLADLAQVHNP